MESSDTRIQHQLVPTGEATAILPVKGGAVYCFSAPPSMSSSDCTVTPVRVQKVRAAGTSHA